MADVLRFDIAKDPKGNPITYGRVGDTDGLTRSIKVFEDGKPLDLTGYVITFEGNTSKYRTKVFDTGGVKLVDASKGEFTYTFPNMAFAVEGQYERAYFSFAKSDTRKTTGDFEIIVFGNSDIDAAEAETIITEYNRLVAELHALQEQAIDDMNQNFAEVESEMEVLAQKISDTQAEIDRALAEFEAGDFYTKAESDEKLEEHTTNIENPHRVTKDQVGLGQVTNDKQATDVDFQNHLADEENPHNVTKSQVGLGNVPNYAVASTEEAEAGIADDKLMTPLKVSQLVKKMMLDLTYPIGTIYTSVTQTNPAELFGGTWERFAKGRTVIGLNEDDADFDTAGKTGGSKTVSVGESNLPNFALVRSSGGTGAGWNITSNVSSGFRNGAATDLGVTKAVPLNNLSPYITVYMWVRTA